MKCFNDLIEDDFLYCRIQDKVIQYKVCVKQEPKGSTCDMFIRPINVGYVPFWITPKKSAHVYDGNCLEYSNLRIFADEELTNVTNLKRAKSDWPDLVVDSNKVETKKTKNKVETKKTKKKVVREEEEEEEEAPAKKRCAAQSPPKNEIEAHIKTFECQTIQTIGKQIRCVQIEPDAQNRMYKIGPLDEKMGNILTPVLKQHNFRYIKKEKLKDGKIELRFRPW